MRKLMLWTCSPRTLTTSYKADSLSSIFLSISSCVPITFVTLYDKESTVWAAWMDCAKDTEAVTAFAIRVIKDIYPEQSGSHFFQGG